MAGDEYNLLQNQLTKCIKQYIQNILFQEI